MSNTQTDTHAIEQTLAERLAQMEAALANAQAEIAVRDAKIAQLAPKAKLPTLVAARLVRKGENAQGRDGTPGAGNPVTTARVDLAYENAGRVSTGHLTLTLARLLRSEEGIAMLDAAIAEAADVADA